MFRKDRGVSACFPTVVWVPVCFGRNVHLAGCTAIDVVVYLGAPVSVVVCRVSGGCAGDILALPVSDDRESKSAVVVVVVTGIVRTALTRFD